MASSEIEAIRAQEERQESSKDDSGMGGWLGIAAAIAGAASGTPAGAGIAKGLSDTWKAQIDTARERDANQAEKYENALFTMKIKGQEERKKAYADQLKVWERIKNLKDTGQTFKAAVEWSKFTSGAGAKTDDIIKELSMREGYEPGKKGTKVKVAKEFEDIIDEQYEIFKSKPVPTSRLDNYATLNYRDALDRGGMFTGMRKAFGISNMEAPMTPYAAASAMSAEIDAEDFRRMEEEAKAEAKETTKKGNIFEVEVGAEAKAGSGSSKTPKIETFIKYNPDGTKADKMELDVNNPEHYNMFMAISRDTSWVRQKPAEMNVGARTTAEVKDIQSNIEAIISNNYPNTANQKAVENLKILKDWMEGPEDSDRRKAFEKVMNRLTTNLRNVNLNNLSPAQFDETIIKMIGSSELSPENWFGIGTPEYSVPTSSTGLITVELPDGQKIQFPDQKSADAFKKEAGL